jgi:hypothetical protein
MMEWVIQNQAAVEVRADVKIEIVREGFGGAKTCFWMLAS